MRVFTGGSDRALHRIRTGDPFLTMPSYRSAARRLNACLCGEFLLMVGVAIYLIVGGSNGG